MGEGDRSPDTKSLANTTTNERARIEYLFNVLKKEGLTVKEILYLSAFLTSFFGLTFNIKYFRGIAKALFDSIVDIEVPQNTDMLNQTISSLEGANDGLSSRNNLNTEG